jgi:Peptidase family M48
MTTAVMDDARFQTRIRRIWWVGRYGPVAGVVAVACVATLLPAAVVIALVGLIPPLVWMACERARLNARNAADIEFEGPASATQRWRRAVIPYWWSCGIAAYTWWGGAVLWLAYAGSTLIGGLIARGRRLRGASPIDPAGLPPLAQRIVASSRRPLRLYSFWGGVPALAFASGRDLVHLHESLVDGDPDQLTAVIAHEVAHHRIGLMRGRLIGTGILAGSWAIAWLAAVASGRLQPSLIEPRDLQPFAPAFATLMAGLGVGRALLDPLALWGSRVTERAADRAALEMLGSGAGYAGFVERQFASNRSPLLPPRAFHVLSSAHPTPAELIDTALSYGTHAPRIVDPPSSEELRRLARRRAQRRWIAGGVAVVAVIGAASLFAFTAGPAPNPGPCGVGVSDQSIRSRLGPNPFRLILAKPSDRFRVVSLARGEQSQDNLIQLTYQTKECSDIIVTEGARGSADLAIDLAPTGAVRLHGVRWLEYGPGELSRAFGRTLVYMSGTPPSAVVALAARFR